MPQDESSEAGASAGLAATQAAWGDIAHEHRVPGARCGWTLHRSGWAPTR